MRNASTEWQVYRTRFLVRAQQLTEPLVFVDALGREHQGHPGDYLVESSDGLQRIAPREIFEDIYVAMGPADDLWPSAAARRPCSELAGRELRRAELNRSELDRRRPTVGRALFA